MRELLPEIKGPSRYLGIEPGAVVKDPARVKVRTALCFPDLYEVGMSYLGQKILYGAVNARPDLWAERAFAPTLETAELMRNAGTPLATLESDTPLAELDVLAFSITHELCYTNVLYMLDLAGLAIESAGRGEESPLVVAGGGCAFNAEPLAPFVDVMVLGDGEEVLPELLYAVGGARERGASRRETLAALAGITGVYAPSFYEAGADGVPHPVRKEVGDVEKRVLTDLDSAGYPADQPVPLADAVHDRLSMEVARGCTRGCRFCHAGMVYRPVRERSLENLTRIIDKSLKRTGYEEMSFLSLSTGDYSALEALFEREVPRCREEQVALALPSLRVGSVSGKIMKHMSGLRRTGATLAPEAGSARLRDVINKCITEEDLLSHVGTLFAHGWTHVKLYFMIGLPTETEEDLAAIFELCEKTRRIGMKGKGRVTASISPFAPKPHTPFQWVRQIGLDEINERVGFLLDLFKGGKGLKLRWRAPEMSLLEGVFSRGDRRLAPVVREAFSRGALFTSWHDHLDLDVWLEVLAEHGMSAGQWLAERDEDAALPWDHLKCGVSKEFLKRESRRALAGKTTRDCRYHGCAACGVCTHTSVDSELRSLDGVELRPRVVRPDRDQSAESAVASEGPVGRPEPPDLGERLEKAQHLRIWHVKNGRAAYLSQIELQRALERAMRRARLPLTFTGGYHPMPRMSFGKALPVGVASAREWFNVYLRRRMDPNEAAAALNAQMPRGLRVIGVEELELKKSRAQAMFEDFLVRYNGETAADAGRLWAEALESDSITAVRESDKKGRREIEVRPLIAGAREISPGVVKVRFDWREKYVSPLAAVAAVAPGAGIPRLIKLRQWMEEPGKPLRSA
jgi:radical SAM family uncharacterized protein/radical SAM-linked protein